MRSSGQTSSTFVMHNCVFFMSTVALRTCTGATLRSPRAGTFTGVILKFLIFLKYQFRLYCLSQAPTRAGGPTSKWVSWNPRFTLLENESSWFVEIGEHKAIFSGRQEY